MRITIINENSMKVACMENGKNIARTFPSSISLPSVSDEELVNIGFGKNISLTSRGERARQRNQCYSIDIRENKENKCGEIYNFLTLLCSRFGGLYHA